MKELERLGDDELLVAVARRLVADGAEGWLVGGAIRDTLRGRPGPLEIDLLVPDDPFGFARRVAAALGGSFVALDEDRQIARVVVGEGGERREIDVAGLRAPSVGEDLGRRDFTVNALAVSLKDLFQPTARPLEVLDPTGGLDDLRARLVRAPAPGVLDDDPLRLLRAVRLAAELDFSIEGKTREAIAERAERLAEVAGERVREELFALLAVETVWPWIEELHQIGLLEVLVPEQPSMVGLEQGRHHTSTLWAHSLATLRHLEEAFGRLNKELPEESEYLEGHLAEPMGANITRRALTKWAALWHDVGKPATHTVDPAGEVHFFGHAEVGAEAVKAISRRLRLGGRAKTFLSRVVAHHLRPLNLSKAADVTRRACYRFFRDLEDAAPAVCLVALADARATREGGEAATDVEGVVRTLLAFRRAQAVAPAPPLLSGRELMAHYGLSEGPVVGRMLASIEEARAAGEVATKDEALAYLDAHRSEWAGDD
ncbi:MAG: HD domain-containing protein [Nitrospinae bacterium]|nr:HD domain-containing protein [Nitrospinota bacterium]